MALSQYEPLRMGEPPTAQALSVMDMCGLLLPHTEARDYRGASWQVLGRDSQMVIVNLESQQEIIMEPGAMVHINEGVEPSMKIGGCGDLCAGESLFRLKYQNTTGTQQSVSLTPVFPAKVVPVDLTRYSGMVIQKGSFFATTGTELKIGVFMPTKLGTCIGAGALLLSTIRGNGIAFLSGGGTIVQKLLSPGEKYVLDTSCFLAAEQSVQVSVRCVGGLKMCCFGGKGLFNTEFTGPGLIIFQSMPLKKAAQAYFPASEGGGGGGGDGGGGDGGGGGGGGG